MSADVRATDAELAAVIASDVSTEERWTFDRIQDGYADGIPRAVFADSEGEPIGIPLIRSAGIMMALSVRVCRELTALREQHRAADEALTRCGIEAKSPRDTLADRIVRLVDRAEEAERERDTAEADCVSYAGKLARLTKERAEMLEIAERATHQRDDAERTRDALREKARAVCDLEWEGAWRMSDEDTLLFSALRAEVD